MHAGFGVATGRSSDLQARPFSRMAFLLTHLPGFGENQWRSGVRSCLPLRGSSGLTPDSLLRAPRGARPASLHKIRQAVRDVNLNDVAVVGQFESGTGIPACAPIVTSRIPAMYATLWPRHFYFFQIDPLPTSRGPDKILPLSKSKTITRRLPSRVAVPWNAVTRTCR
jgi:hypothetical protein